jgi:hypothetical protein
VKNVAVGAALGILLGLLVGLSASEVVAGVVTGLVGLLGTILGLRSEDAAGPLPGGNAARVGGFAVAMAVILVLALLVRTHGLLEPSPAERAAAWAEAGFSAKEAAEIVVFERTGLLPKNRTAGAAVGTKGGTGALFGADSAEICDTLLSRNYGAAQALDGALRAEGGPWEALAASVSNSLNDAERLRGLRGALEAACNIK